ncbi:class A beta-lactamase-related serine hydrolase [Aquimarina sp. U1-2]|uniref:serine hydrolase n=1 Tax=Aquimarina sp. U1-2 TaxID=2823141 RepID=UPI001AECAB94|nr:serine hydrolase [Aquimarina sp. U1-2]MBP2833027.1 class A beta-lactamase-related serine hydrolase [Aquimarina sp. U1-2]
MKRKLNLPLLFSFVFFTSKAQVSKNTELFKNIIQKDSLLFNIGFNNCDISQFENHLVKDFEFFHDKGGKQNKAEFLNALKNGLCKSPEQYQSRRELINTSTKIYPLYNNKILYGAIQVGLHNFYETLNGQQEQFASSADFTHVWVLENKDWKLKRSLSFNHKSQKEEPIINLYDPSALRKWLIEKHVPVLGLGIINDGQLEEIKVFGNLNNEKKAPYNTIFNVASLTKPVTAYLALKLASENKLDVDEPVYNYWVDPDLKNDERHKLLTVRHILSHQTGFPNWRNKQLKFQFTPGTNYQYSGEGFEYLRKVLEIKFNTSLNQLAEELIFVPLKMNDTQYIWDENIDDARVAKGFNKNGKAYETYKRKTANGADDLLTTIKDYGTFLSAVLNGNGLSEKIFNEMQTNQIASQRGKHFGLGFEKYDFKDGNFALSHSGADNGVQTIAFIFPKTKQGILIFTNIDDGYKVYEGLLNEYLGGYGSEIIEIETGNK